MPDNMHDDGAAASVQRLVEVVGLLRRHCPWTAALDHATLLRYLVEETYELYEVVDDVSREGQPGTGMLDDLRDELGDLLFQVVLHAQLQAERGTFALADVVGGLTDKLVRRSPHVFSPDGSLRAGLADAGSSTASTAEIADAWRAAKGREKPLRTSPFDGIPHGLPALSFAVKTLNRIGGGAASSAIGTATGTAISEGEGDAEATLGRELLALVGRAVSSGLDPERALRRAVLDLQRTALDDAR